jgi:hypothetical protein
MKYLFLILLVSCGHFKKHESTKPSASTNLDEVRVKREAVKLDVASSLDPLTGWPSANDCDATLWGGLACSVGLPVNIKLAEYAPGEIHRRPFKACWNEIEGDVGSKSTISKDMLLGYTSCLWAQKDLAGLQALANYGEAHDWLMGKPTDQIGRVLLSGNGVGLLGRMVYVLSNSTDDRYYRRTGYLYPTVTLDYERHLQTHGILLQDEVDQAYNLTAINSEMLDRLLENYTFDPLNPLFAAALAKFTGDYGIAINLLMADDTPCPTYARGEKPELYCKINWLHAAKLVLGD